MICEKPRCFNQSLTGRVMSKLQKETVESEHKRTKVTYIELLDENVSVSV